MSHRKYIRISLSLLVTVLFVFTAGACAAPAGPVEATEHEDEHVDDHEHDDHEETGEVTRIPNDGAVIEIVSPEAGAVFAAGEDIVVEVSIENFALNQDGTHWHVYVDGESYAMVVGETTTQVIRILDPGEHTITAYLANGDHQELEEGGEVTIVMEE